MNGDAGRITRRRALGEERRKSRTDREVAFRRLQLLLYTAVSPFSGPVPEGLGRAVLIE